MQKYNIKEAIKNLITKKVNGGVNCNVYFIIGPATPQRTEEANKATIGDLNVCGIKRNCSMKKNS